MGLGLVTGLSGGCGKGADNRPEVVLYTSVDEVAARPIIEAFERQSGIRVLVQKDSEATKTVGLAERLEAEKANPQADVYWGNEVFHTIGLAEQGVLAAYESPSAKDIPAQYKDAQGRWAGTSLRARVIARSTQAEAARGVNSIQVLANPALKGRICMARPVAGTTRGHVAALYTAWGPERFEQFLNQLKANDVKLLGGNGPVAEAVGGGAMWAGLTDNDDVDATLRKGGRLDMVLPDQKAEQIGTLTIPCTVGLVAGARRADAGKKLVDYLLSKEVEQKLLEAKFARYSVFAPAESGGAKPMHVDYAKVAGNMKAATEMSLRVLEGRR